MHNFPPEKIELYNQNIQPVEVCLPDGNQYDFYTLTEKNEITFLHNKKLPFDKETRIALDTPHADLVQSIAHYRATLREDISPYTIEEYKGTHFRLHHVQSEEWKEREHLAWGNYSREFAIRKLPQKEYSLEDTEKTLDFMETSFGSTFQKQEGKTVLLPNDVRRVKIRTGIEKALTHPFLNTYFIEAKNTNACVGIFSLLHIPNEELQLHSVAGKSSIPSPFIHDKMQLMLSGILKSYREENAKEQLDLTFTCSKPAVVELYRKAGFLVDEVRRMLVVRKY